MPGPTAGKPSALGALHIHTNRSDGSGTPDEVAAAAARAGLQFIVLTDHGDGTRAPDAPQYRSGVLVIDAVELSTDAGHYIAIGLPESPYPLRGEPRDVVEDVRRLGGFGIVAHPDSSKPDLQWHDWDAPFDAMEWLNADTEWRDERASHIARALVQYPFRPAETLASLLDRPEATLTRWDALTQRRPVVALAGADAHARAGWMDDDASGYRQRWFLRLPSYETSFRAFATRVELATPLQADPIAAAAQIISALKAGRVFSAVTALAAPAALEFTAGGTDGETATQGDLFDPKGGRVSFAARSNAPTGSVTALRKDGRIVTQTARPDLNFEGPREDGTYRVEVYLPTAPGDPPVPWILSNPIYVRPAGWGTAAPISAPAMTDRSLIQGGPWHVEKDAASTAAFTHADPPDGPVEFRYRLGSGERAGQYAALGISVGTGLAQRTQLAFRARASQPMRLSVQARRPQSGDRWQRSIYIDTNARDINVPFTGMMPVGGASAFNPGLADTVLFVVDLTNALPGTDGVVTIDDLRFER